MSALSFYFAKAAVSIHYGKKTSLTTFVTYLFFGYDCERYRM